MIGVTLALVAATLICLFFEATQLLGVVGVALLVYLHPLLFGALLVLGCVTFYFIHRNQRRKHHALPRPDTRRD